MQKHVNLVDLFKSFPTRIYLQNLASIQPRRSPLKFARSSGAASPSRPAPEGPGADVHGRAPRRGRDRD